MATSMWKHKKIPKRPVSSFLRMSLASKQMFTNKVGSVMIEEIGDSKKKISERKAPGLFLQNGEGIQNLLKI